MRRRIVLLLAVLLASGLSFLSFEKSEVSAQTLQKPNFVFILADDMRKDDLRYMPKTRSLLGDQGMRFGEAFVSNPACCPSRATIMRGQYSHNTGVWFPKDYEAYRKHEDANLATRLDRGGYRTALIGKYFNGYGSVAGNFVPPGWDEWFASTAPRYFDYEVNVNGQIRRYGTSEEDYQTDVLRARAEEFIGNSAASGEPFFAYVAPKAPHGPPTPASRHRHTYDGEKAPRPPSFNEKDVSDKPPWIQRLPELGDTDISEIDAHHEGRAETLQALDDLVEGIVGKLESAGVMSNTYVFFTSDNGYFQGEHRIPFGKWRPYEEAVRMPLLVRGPGVAAGTTTRKLVLNTDYFPTFTDLAGIKTPGYVDGRSLRRVLTGNASTWRTAILLEGPRYNYRGIRTRTGDKYVRYEGGAKELYDLRADPYELRNGYDPAAPPAVLSKRLTALKGCAGDGCRAAEDGP